MGDVVIDAEAGHLLASKISSIVGDDSMGDPEAAYYVLPEELNNLPPTDFEDGIVSIYLVK